MSVGDSLRQDYQQCQRSQHLISHCWIDGQCVCSIEFFTNKGKILNTIDLKDTQGEAEMRLVMRKRLLQVLADGLPKDSIQFQSNVASVNLTNTISIVLVLDISVESFFCSPFVRSTRVKIGRRPRNSMSCIDRGRRGGQQNRFRSGTAFYRLSRELWREVKKSDRPAVTEWLISEGCPNLMTRRFQSTRSVITWEMAIVLEGIDWTSVRSIGLLPTMHLRCEHRSARASHIEFDRSTGSEDKESRSSVRRSTKEGSEF